MASAVDYNAITCVVVGSCYGKTALLIQATTGKFTEEFITTMFDNYVMEGIKLDGGQSIKLKFFDTSGAEEYDRLRPLCYPEADIFLACFSIDSPSSFEIVKEKWLLEIKHHCPTTPMILVGTKLDLRDDQKTVERLAAKKKAPISYKQGETLAKEIKAVAYIECSAKTSENVTKVIELVGLWGYQEWRKRLAELEKNYFERCLEKKYAR